MAMIMG